MKLTQWRISLTSLGPSNPLLAAALIAGSLMALSIPTARAATLSVPSQYATIQAAVTAANAGDTVQVADGTYTGAGNVNIDFAGKNITVTSVDGSAKTIIDCQTTSRGFYFHTEERPTAVVNGFTIQNGSATDYGGGIEITNSTPTIQNCVFTNDTAPEGGGISIVNTSPSIINCSFTCSTTSYGAAIYVDYGSPPISGCTYTKCSGDYALFLNQSNVVLTNDTFTENSGGAVLLNFGSLTANTCTFTANSGGAMGIFNSGSLTVTNSSFTSNTTKGSGGAIDGDTFYSGSVTATVTSCSFTANSAADGGGAIYLRRATVGLTGSTFSQNQASDGAGAIDSEWSDTTITGSSFIGNIGSQGAPGGVYANENSLTVISSMFINNASGGIGLNSSLGVIQSSTFSGNYTIGSSGCGGGIAVVNDSILNDSKLQLVSCTLFANTASLLGGGLYINSATSASVVNCTFNANSLTDGTGGAIAIQGTKSVGITNDILYGDQAGSNPEISLDSTSSVVATNNDIEGGYGSTTYADPLWVAPLATPPDFHLQAGSPCYQAGTATGAPTTTEDGYPRPNPPSIGAYELEPSQVPAVPTSLTATAGNAQVSLSWTGSTGATSYNIYRATASGAEGTTAIATGITSTNYTNTGLTNGVTCFYKVAAVNGSGTSAPSNEASATPIAPASGATHILWSNTSGTLSLWAYNPATGTFTQNSYGPYTGWTAKAIADGPDGMTRVLWVNTSGTASIWSVNNVTGTFTQTTFGPYAGWTANALSVGADNTTRILWTSTTGAASIWNYTGTATITQVGYGPYSGWSAKSIADGPDGLTQALWVTTAGTASIWSLNAATGAFTQTSFGPYTGWSATALSVGSTNITHVLWTNASGAASLWNYTGTTSITQNGFGPYTGWTPKSVADASDGLTRLLWGNTAGAASIWDVNSSTGTFNENTFGPFNGWVALAVSAAP